MNTVPITAEAPHLDAVLGPLSPEEDREARTVLLDASATLVSTAARLGGRAGWHGRGLALEWFPSGGVAIGCCIGTLDSANNAATFSIELRPGWVHGDRTGVAEWEIETSVDVDCQHSPDHGDHEVFRHVERAASVDDALTALASSVQALVAITVQPLDYWTAQGGA